MTPDGAYSSALTLQLLKKVKFLAKTKVYLFRALNNKGISVKHGVSMYSLKWMLKSSNSKKILPLFVVSIF